MIITNDVAERVERGVALLDEQGPADWRSLITETVLMRHKFNCILGQVFGHFDTGLRELDMMYSDAGNYGFDGMSPGVDPYDPFNYEARHRDYDDLQEEWIRRLSTDA